MFLNQVFEAKLGSSPMEGSRINDRIPSWKVPQGPPTLLEMHSLDKTAQDSAQLNIKDIQHWKMHHLPKEIVPLTDWSHCEKFSLCPTGISL